MSINEMNRRLETIKQEKVAQVQRLLANGYSAKDVYNFRIGVKLRNINAVQQMMGLKDFG